MGVGSPLVVDREVEEVGVRLTRGQEGLAALDVLEEGRGVLPHSAGRGHIDGGVELPAREGGTFWRVRCSVEVDVVDACGEHTVDFRFALAQRGSEVLGEPGECLAGSVFLAADVGCRRGELQDGGISVVRALDRVLAEAGDVEVAATVGLAFRDVHLGVNVEQVGRRAVGLVAYEGAVAVAPFDPRGDEVLPEESAEEFAVVSYRPVVVAEFVEIDRSLVFL